MAMETDLVLEASELWNAQSKEAGKLKGVESRTHVHKGFEVTEVHIFNEQGAEQLGKPVGRYFTIAIGTKESRAVDSFSRATEVLGELLRMLLPQKAQNTAHSDSIDPALVVGLGNRAITPDAVGPWAVDKTIVTRHLIEHVPDTFGGFRPVAAVATGVLGTTGVESGELVKALCEKIHPSVVIVIDALVARSAERLCTTIQLANTGIVPGSGVGNARFALTEQELGVPVIAVGVPTIIRANTLATDLHCGEPIEQFGNLMVTPKDIDASAMELAKIVGYGVSMALQDGLCVSDVELLLS